MALLPSSSAAAGSFALVRLPELPRFSGPANHVVAAARFSAPLLVLGSYYTLAIHGVLSLAALAVAGGLGLFGMVSAHATLLVRRRRLLGAARALRSYAERAVGGDHELYQRAERAIALLEQDTLALDPTLTTDVEQGIGYTRELLLGVRGTRKERCGGEAQARRAAGGARPL